MLYNKLNCVKMTGALLLRAISTLFHNIIGIIFGAGNQFHDYIAFQKDFFEDMDFGLIHNSNKTCFMVFCYFILQNCSIRQASYWKLNGAQVFLKSQRNFHIGISRDISILVIQSRLQVLKLSPQILVKSQV